MARPYNILLIMSDQHNGAVMGCAGDRWVRTPYLDRLARDGMILPRFYTNAPLCVPARSCFLTGRLPGANRVWHNQAILGSSIPTWAHALSLGGYRTALVGRMHFEGPDQRHGFLLRPHGEPFAIHPGAGVPVESLYRTGMPVHSGQDRVVMLESGKGKGAYEVADEDTTDAALAFIRNLARDPDSRPFAAVVGFILPHCPFIGDPEPFDRYYRQLPLPRVTQADRDRLPRSVRDYLARRGLLEPLPDDRIRSARAAYYAMVESLDRMIGRIVGELEAAGLADETLVIYTSDHGEMAGEHGCWTKSCFYEGAERIPFIARLPGVVSAGAVSKRIASLVDLSPTFADIAGVPAPDRSDGVSLMGTLRGGSHGDTAVGEAVSEIFDPMDGKAGRMLRSGRWKIWEFEGDDAPVLFDLDEDPDEEADLGSVHRFAEVRDRLRGRLREGWDPAGVRTEALQQLADYVTLAKWGGRHGPRLPEATGVDVLRESFQRV